MRIISRIFLASYLRLFFTILLGSLVAIAIVEMLLKFDDVVESRTAAGIVAYFLVRIPGEYARDVIPVASFAAAFLCIGGPARAREITALKAAGVSPLRVVLPVVIASLALSLLAFGVNETLVLRAERSLNDRSHAGDGITFRRGSFWYHRGDAVYNIRDADLGARALHGVTVFRLNARGRLIESLHADHVNVEDGGWVLVDGLRRRFDPTLPESPPGVEPIEQTALDLGGARDLALLNAEIEQLSIPELREYISVRVADGRDPIDARGRLQRRLADPLSVMVFAWIALPLGFAVERTRSFAVSGLIGIAWIGLYYTLRTAASLVVTAGVASAIFAPWLLLAGFASLGAWSLARTPR